MRSPDARRPASQANVRRTTRTLSPLSLTSLHAPPHTRRNLPVVSLIPQKPQQTPKSRRLVSSFATTINQEGFFCSLLLPSFAYKKNNQQRTTPSLHTALSPPQACNCSLSYPVRSISKRQKQSRQISTRTISGSSPLETICLVTNSQYLARQRLLINRQKRGRFRHASRALGSNRHILLQNIPIQHPRMDPLSAPSSANYHCIAVTSCRLSSRIAHPHCSQQASLTNR